MTEDELTEDDITEVPDEDLFLQVFAEIDVNNSGFISKAEFKNYVFREFGTEDTEFNEFMEKYRKGMDENHDEKLNVDEFEKFCLLMVEIAELK